MEELRGHLPPAHENTHEVDCTGPLGFQWWADTPGSSLDEGPIISANAAIEH